MFTVLNVFHFKRSPRATASVSEPFSVYFMTCDFISCLIHKRTAVSTCLLWRAGGNSGRQRTVNSKAFGLDSYGGRQRQARFMNDAWAEVKQFCQEKVFANK